MTHKEKSKNMGIIKRVGAGLRVCVAPLVLFAVSACGSSAAESTEPSVSKAEKPLIYGVDGRLDVLDHPDASLRKLALNSTPTMMRTTDVFTSNPGNISFNSHAYTDSPISLCPDQPFAFDPLVGQCSGTLIDDDLVLTAGHCIASVPCSEQSWVFNFRKSPSGTLATVTSDDVFTCAEVMVQANEGLSWSDNDYAIIRLDRSARPRFTPAPVRLQKTSLTAGTRLGLIGSPEGIPTKIDSSGSVRDPEASAVKFNATVDSFPGNSGSGVYETGSYQVVGVVVAGETFDYAVRQGVGCSDYRTCSDTGCLGVQVVKVFQPINALCSIHPEYSVCQQRNEQAFFAQNTNGATQNTVNRLVFLQPGQTIDFGTCSVPGSTGQFNTQIGLYSPTGALLASNDDGGGSCGQLSHATYTVPPLRGGLYELRSGCNTTSTCYGTTAYTTSGPGGGTLTYDATGTSSATAATRNVNVTLRVGETLIAGTCGVEQGYSNGAVASGDTFLRLFSGSTEVANNDDAVGVAGCGVSSRFTYTATTAGTYQLRAGCYSSNSCSGTLSYVIQPGGSYDYSASSTVHATVNTVNRTVRLEAGDIIQVGTCGLPGATGTGDTFLRLYNASNTEVQSNDDAPGCGLNSYFAHTVATAGNYQILSGCYSGNSCSGTTAYKILRKGNGTGTFAFSASNTAYDTANYVREPFILREGQNVIAGTCGVSGSSGSGDTILKLFGPDGSQVTENDEGGCSSGLSKLTYFVPKGGDGAYEIRSGCGGNTACSGTVAYTE